VFRYVWLGGRIRDLRRKSATVEKMKKECWQRDREKVDLIMNLKVDVYFIVFRWEKAWCSTP